MKAITDNVKYKQTIAMLSDNIHKADSSLNKQMVIQKQSSKLLNQVDASMLLQNKTFKQSQVLNNQQHEATDDIERTLNPLLPFQIDLTLYTQPSSINVLSAFTKILQLYIDSAKNLSWSGEVVKLNNSQGLVYLINSTYENYDFFSHQISHIKIVLTFSRRLKDGTVKTLECEVPEDYMADKEHFKDIQALYIQYLNTYSVKLDKLPIKVTSYGGVGFNSTKDLADATLKVKLMEAPGAISNISLKFRFPPDFSRINQLLITNKGENVPDRIYTTYTMITKYKEK